VSAASRVSASPLIMMAVRELGPQGVGGEDENAETIVARLNTQMDGVWASGGSRLRPNSHSAMNVDSAKNAPRQRGQPHPQSGESRPGNYPI
jgi:hypothetical protein